MSPTDPVETPTRSPDAEPADNGSEPGATPPSLSSRAGDLDGRLRRLAFGHRLFGWMSIVFALIPFLSLGAFGVFGVFEAFEVFGGGGPLDWGALQDAWANPEFGPLGIAVTSVFGFFVAGLVAMFLLWTFGLPIAWLFAARFLDQRRYWGFLFVVALLSLVRFPFGTLLGAFALYELLQTQTVERFRAPAAPR